MTVGSWPRAKSWARRKASSRSVLRLVCSNFQASLAVLATGHGRPSSWHSSCTQPASRQASMTTAAGRCRVNSLRRCSREVGRVSQRARVVSGS